MTLPPGSERSDAGGPRPRMTRVALAPWRLAVAVLLALAVLALIIAVAVWLAIALAVVGAILWLNLVLIPRLAARLPACLLELILLPLFAGAGWAIGGPTGAGLGATAWLAGIAVPRLIGRRLRARQRRAAPPGRIIVVDRLTD